MFSTPRKKNENKCQRQKQAFSLQQTTKSNNITHVGKTNGINSRNEMMMIIKEQKIAKN